MRLLAAAATGLCIALAAAVATGRPPRLPTLRSRPRQEVTDRQLWLVQAGVQLTPRQFVAASAALGVVVFALVTAATDTPVVALVPAASAALGPRVYYGRVRARRMQEVQQAWPDGLREIIAGVAAGMSLSQAVVLLSRDGPEPLRRAFARFPLLVRMLGVGPALEVVKEELADPTSDRVIEVLLLAHERGGRLVTEILRDLADATTDDVRTLEEITTSGLEQKINARAVFVLPWVVLLALTARPGHFRDFYQSPAGVVVVAVAGVASLVGMWLVGRLGREPDEERMLGGAATPAPPGAAP